MHFYWKISVIYGIILAATTDNTLHNSFDEILPILKNTLTKEGE